MQITAAIPQLRTIDLAASIDFSVKPTRIRLRAAVALAAVAVLTRPLEAQTTASPNGTIVRSEPCPPRPTRAYDQYVESTKAEYFRQIEAARKIDSTVRPPTDFSRILLTREDYDRREGYTGVECQRIQYMSDGLKIAGYLWKPRDANGKHLPLVIFNRGGTRERSKLTPWMAGGFYEFVSRGYVVLASQYRGVDGGEGSEEYGGADVHDVLNLVPAARSLGYVDMDNVFLFGNSRGGMMTYLALKQGMKANAAAVMSGISDLSGNAEDHPEYYPESYRSLIPDYASRPADAMRERSVVAWAETIRTPLLILHGTADPIVSARRPLELAQRLQALGATYELVMYANDGHGLPMSRVDSDRRVAEWFARYRR